MARKMRTLPLLAVVVGFALTSAGCASMADLVTSFSEKWEATATSKMLLNAANDLLVQRENGYSIAQFKAAFGKKFAITDVKNSNLVLNFTYKGKSYRIYFNGDQHDGIGYTVWVAAKDCYEKIPKEKK